MKVAVSTLELLYWALNVNKATKGRHLFNKSKNSMAYQESTNALIFTEIFVPAANFVDRPKSPPPPP